MSDGSYVAIEIKLGASKIEAGAEALLDFRDRMQKHKARFVPCSMCVVCGLADRAT